MKSRTTVFAVLAIVALLQTGIAGQTSRTSTILGFAVTNSAPQTATAVLSVSSGIANPPGGANPLGAKPLMLMKESLDAFFKRTGMFQGPPGTTVKEAPLAVWAYSCRTGSPVCKQALYEAQPIFVANVYTDSNGRATFPGVAPGTYYLFAQAIADNQHYIWDLRVDLKSGSNSVSLDLRNITPLDANQARAKAAAGGGGQSADTAQTCPVTDASRAIKSGGRANSNLAVRGAGYVYTYQRKNEYGRVLDSFTERGNFSNTTLYLLDDDAENVLQSAGIGPGLLGSPFAMMLFIENTTLLEPGKLNEIAPGMGSIFSILGGEKTTAEMTELAQTAKSDFDCAMKAIRAHSVARITTDANARATFPSVPAGTYYLYGSFYRVHKPVRTGGLVWNLRVELKPGQNPIILSVNNVAWKQP